MRPVRPSKRRWAAFLLAAGAGVLLLCQALSAASAPLKPKKALDRFGIAMIVPTLPGGREWYSKWDNARPRVLKSRVDPDDPEFDTGHGDSVCEIDGRGVLKAAGRTPRLYVYDHSGRSGWGSVEITLYGMRVKEAAAVGYAGLMAYAKTNHTVDAEICEDLGYGGRLTYDGRADFEKEIAHHVSNGGYVQTAEVHPWPGAGAMPKNVWIGYKFIARDADGGKSVKLELWRDMTDGKNGGKWELLTSTTDAGE